MSEVSSSSSDNAALADYYRRAMGELQEAQDRENKRTRAHHEKEIKDIQDNYTKATRNKEEETNQNVDNIRRDSNDAISRTRDQYASDLENLKATYDKQGRYNGPVDPEVYKKIINEQAESSRIQQDDDRRAFNDAQ